uniref:Serine/threonine-protein phosphatase 2A activator n=1 Tax=Salmo trutta TaxID=8032 RepID=A0A674EKC2_SALTR
ARPHPFLPPPSPSSFPPHARLESLYLPLNCYSFIYLSLSFQMKMVNQSLIRMYKAECLEKFSVIQHFKFGSLKFPTILVKKCSTMFHI